MTRKRISHLSAIDASIFLYELPPTQAENVLGGDGIVDLSTVYDGMNNTSTKFSSLLSVGSNKLFSVDVSKLTMNLVMMFPNADPVVLRWPVIVNLAL